jgi:hypothetical protein
MPYRNIVFIKLEKRLLNDWRFFTLSEESQLNFIKILLCLAQNYNKMPKKLEIIKTIFHTKQHINTIEKSIKNIQVNFPKFKEGKDFYYMEDFEEKTNYIPDREIPRKSQGLPKDVVDKEEDKIKKKIKSNNAPDFLTSLKTNPVYNHINLDFELGKMDTWLLAHHGRQKTKRFIVNWLNKIEKPLPINKQVDNTDALIKADHEKMEKMKRDAIPMPEDCRVALAKVGVKIPRKG